MATPTPTPTPRPAPTATPTPTPAPRVKLAEGATPWVNQNAKKGGVLRVSRLGACASHDYAIISSDVACILALAPRYDSLLRNAENSPGAVAPDLAKSWTISADGTVVTFTLRAGVLWHDGTPLTAADVKASYDRIANPPPGIPSPWKDWFTPVASMEAVDALTFRATFKRPYPQFFPYMAAAQNSINQKKALESASYDLNKTPTFPGTGPFKYKRHAGTTEWAYDRNDKYWNGDLPFLDSYEFYGLTAESQGPALLAGRLDMVRTATAPVLNSIQGRPRIKLLPRIALWEYHFWLNLTKPPFNDIRVRQALNLIYDRKVLLDASQNFYPGSLAGDYWVPTGSAWFEDLVGDTWKQKPGIRGVSQADAAEAVRLMKEAGYEKGLGVIEVDHWPSLSPLYTWPTDVLQAQIKKYLPGTTEFKYLTFTKGEAANRLSNNAYQASAYAFDAGIIDDPAQWLKAVWVTGGQSPIPYSNPELEAILEKAAATLARAEAVKLYQQAIAILDRELPSLPSTTYPVTNEAAWDYVKDTGCELPKRGNSVCSRFDWTWLDK